MGQLDRAARTREFAGQACNMAVEGSEASICPSVLGSVLSAGVGLPLGGGKAARRSEFGKLAPAVFGETDFESYSLSSAVSGAGGHWSHPPTPRQLNNGGGGVLDLEGHSRGCEQWYQEL